MTKKKDKFGIDDETRKKLVEEVIRFFAEERGEEVGYIAAEAFLDFALNTIGEKVYQSAFRDCKKIVKEKMDSLEVELDVVSYEK